MIRQSIAIILFTASGLSLAAQKGFDIINVKEVERIEKTLASDDMRGRSTFTPDIDKAADFIAAEFAKSKLHYGDKATTYFQEFSLVKPKLSSLSGTIDGDTITEANFFAHSSQANVQLSSSKGYEMLSIKKEEDFYIDFEDIKK